MDKKDIVARFLEEGRQLDASALDYFMKVPEDVEEFIQSLHNTRAQPTTITLDLVRSVLKKDRPTIKIIKKFFINHENETTSISDYSRRLVNYYESKKQMLINKADPAKFLSINKIQKQKEFVLICMVREKDHVEKSAVMEDLTGNTVVYFESADVFERILENDIILIICEATAEGIRAKKVIWPDVPLKRLVNKTKQHVYCLFISDFHIDSKQFNKKRYGNFIKWIEDIQNKTNYEKIYVFILGGISQNKSDVESLLNTLPKNSFKIFLKSKKDATVNEREDLLSSAVPTMVEIEGIKLLLCQGDELYPYRQFWKSAESPTDIMINILKRRDLAPFVGAEAVLTPLRDTIIDQVPDIFASGSFHSACAANYKGVTVITTGDLAGDPTFWAVNLNTREINKLVFS